MKDSLLIVGGEGLLGGALRQFAKAQGWPANATFLNPEPAGPNSITLDLRTPPDSWNPPGGTRAAVLCAAITSLDACRRDPAATRLVNVTHTLALAHRLASAGVFVVFISSNLVFDGSVPRVAAGHPANPQTEYGRQKADVEAGLHSLGPGGAIVRLTKVIHPRWPLVQGWVQALRDGGTVEAFADLHCAPIPVGHVARGLATIAWERRSGTWQFSAESDVSYAGMAAHLARRLGLDPARVRAVESRGRAGLEHNPAHTTLDASRASAELDLTFPPPLEAAERAFLAEP